MVERGKRERRCPLTQMQYHRTPGGVTTSEMPAGSGGCLLSDRVQDIRLEALKAKLVYEKAERSSANGRFFWKYHDPKTGKLEYLDKLRREFAEKESGGQ